MAEDNGAGHPPIELVIFDLDGTVIQTETLVLAVARDVVRAHGKELTEAAIAASLGRRPLDAWAAVAEALGISAAPEELFAQSEPILTERWHEAGLLPGALRLVAHLRSAGVSLALATSTSRATLQRKLSSKPAVLREAFVAATVCGDDADVAAGKPAPDCFLAAAAAAGVPPSRCLVIEDAPCGVTAAVAAGMRVVVVPSLHGPAAAAAFPAPAPAAAAGVVEVLPSLLAFRPERYGLPPFTDRIGETIPLDEVFRISGTVVRGFGRGSRQLGIPTANLDSAALAGALAEAVTGIYAGWASLEEGSGTGAEGTDGATGTTDTDAKRAVYPMVMSVGWNPVFGNKDKTAEPWILHDFEGRDFYGARLRVTGVAFIRPEADFPSLEALVQRIHRDAEVTREVLRHEAYARYRDDPFLQGL